MTEEKVKQIIRILNTDLDGNKPIYHALRKVKGISYIYSNALCNLSNINRNKKAGALSIEEIKKLEDLAKGNSLPIWLFNRRKDPDSGKNIHLFGVDLKLRQEFDIKKMKQIKSYKGMRHSVGLPVRGQSTKAHFRHGRSVGVMRKAVKAAVDSGKKDKKEK